VETLTTAGTSFALNGLDPTVIVVHAGLVVSGDTDNGGVRTLTMAGGGTLTTAEGERELEGRGYLAME